MANVLNLQADTLEVPQEAKHSGKSVSICWGGNSGNSWTLC